MGDCPLLSDRSSAFVIARFIVRVKEGYWKPNRSDEYQTNHSSPNRKTVSK